jgi:hypothetical protein
MANFDINDLLTRLKKNVGPSSSMAQTTPDTADSIAQDLNTSLNVDAAPVEQKGFVAQTVSSGLSPADKEKRNMIEQQLFQGLQDRLGGLPQDQALMEMRAQQSQPVDLSGAYEIARAAGAKDAGAKYVAPKDTQIDDVSKLKTALEKAQGGITDDQENFLRYQAGNRDAQSQRNAINQQRLNEMIYGKQVSGLRNDKVLNDLVEKNNAITRTSDILFSPGQQINTTSLHDLQQTVTGALTGLKGSGGVTERSQRYMDSLETKFAELEQKFGNVDSIPMDNPILQHYLTLAQEGQAFIQEQADKRVKTLSGGHENITNLPTYKDMFQQQIDDIKSNIAKPRYNQTTNKTAQNFKSTYGASPNTAVATGSDMASMAAQELARRKKNN